MSALLLNQESLMLPVNARDQLHVRRIWCGDKPQGKPVLMFHGAAEDGLIFYSHGGRGLACWLAREGWQVFVPDMRGKGRSWPAINQHSDFGFHEVVTEDIPALGRLVGRMCPGQPQTWVTHSLGGPLAAAALIRDGADAYGVSQMVHFGARRLISAHSFKRRMLVDLLWNRIGRLGVSFQGYCPSDRLGLGTARESARSFHDGINWSTREQWIDSEDGVDYSQKSGRRPWVRSLYFASAADIAFGNPDDVRDFMHELGRHDGRMIVLSRDNGNMQDYSHTGILMHPDAELDHFPQMAEWMRDGA